MDLNLVRAGLDQDLKGVTRGVFAAVVILPPRLLQTLTHLHRSVGEVMLIQRLLIKSSLYFRD